MKTVAIYNRKGGVGKTTYAVHLAEYAVEQGLRVLFVDYDDQANSTDWFNRDGVPMFSASVLFAEDCRVDALADTPLTLAYADNELMGADMLALDVAAPLAAANLRRLAKSYDLCIIDCPSSTGNRPLAAMVAADYLVTPFDLEAFGMRGVEKLLEIISVAQGFNPRLEWLGILPNRYKPRRAEHRKALAELAAALPAHLLPKTITDRPAVASSSAHFRPVWRLANGANTRKVGAEMRAACELVRGRVFA